MIFLSGSGTQQRTYNKMKSNIYQFSVNLSTLPSQEQQEESLGLLFRDIFPYLALKSLTFAIQLAALFPFLLQLSYSTLLPNDSTYTQNLFAEICGFLAKSMVFLRLASEYEYRLGFKYFMAILISVGVVHLVGSMLIGLSIQQLFLNNSSLLSIYVLSTVDLNKLKESQLIQYEKEEKVENYDLLDLNDTIVKLKNRENNFTYDSYTNKEFYTHHFPAHSKQKNSSKKNIKSVIKKSNTFSQIIDSSLDSSETQTLEIKVYKLILFNFIVFAHSSLHQFGIFLLAEVGIYTLISTRLFKRVLQ